MKEKISKIMLKRTNQIIALIVLIITAIGAIAVSRNRIKNITNLDSETARAMTYGEVQAGDEKTETPYVEFNSYFLRDLNNDGIAEKIKGTCKEISQTDTLYMDINVLTNGYLENGKIEIQGENFVLQTAIVKDAVVAKNSISENTKTIELNKINNGTQKLLMGKVKANIGKNINNYSSNNNKIILTGTHVTEDGTRTEIRKEIVLSADWYGKVENTMLVTTSNTIYDINNALDEKNGKVNLEFVVETYETLNELLLKTSTIEGTIPELNGYKPIEVKITGENIEYTYDETTGKFTATNKSTLNTNTGAVTREAYNSTYWINEKSYRRNIYNLKVVYPYEAYETLGRDTISLNIPVNSVYEGYNNQNTEFENPVKSNTAQYSYTFIWRNGTEYKAIVGTYRSTDRKYIVSKKEPLKIYSGELNGDISEDVVDKYETSWYLNTTKVQENNKAKLQLKEPTTNYGDKFLTTESKYIDMTPYTKNIGIYFDGARNLVKEDGYINLYNDETNELIHTFTKEELAEYTRSNPYMYESGIKHIRLETSEVNDGSTTVCNIKQIDDEALTTAYTKAEFDKLQYIYTYLQVNTMQTNGTWSQSGSDTDRAIYEEPISRTQLELSRTQFSTQEREKNVDIKIETVANYFNIDKWKNGSFLVKLPSEILDVEVNNVKISNNNVKVLGYEVLEKDSSKFIKILTQNETPASYTLTVNVDITADPRILTTSKTVELYAYNQETNNYAEKSADKYDVNDNGNVSENVNYVTKSIDLISPSSLLTNEKISNYNSKGDFVVSPQIAEIDIDETKNATIEVSITNNYSGAISDIVVIGKIPFKGNKYQLQDTTDLGSTITTNLTGPITLPTELSGIAKVYYSENETITKDITNSNNNLKLEKDITDWSKIKTYVIDLGYHKLEVDKEYKFIYKIELPTVLKYNEVTYSTHAVYFALNTENGRLYTQTEAGKVGIRVARKYDINITKTKLGKDVAVQGTTFCLVEEGQEEGKVVVTNYEGKATIQNVYAERTYILKEVMPSIGYSTSNTEVKFRTYIENDELKYEIISGQAKTNSVTQATEDTKAHIDFSFENVPKYTMIINKKDTEGNNLKSVKYRITGNNIDKNVYTNKDGIAKIQDLEAGEEYTLTEERATGYYILQEPIKFKLNNNNGTLSFTTISGSFNSNAQITESTEVSGKQAEDKVEVSLVNEKIPTYNLQITKYAKDQETTLSGAQFKIEGEGIKEGGEYITTDESGILTIEGIYQYVEGKYITGEYTITEITPPEGYKLIEEPIKVRYNNGTLEILSGTIKGETTVENGIAKIKVENEPLFVLTKINEVTKAPIQGVKFAIYEIDENRDIVDYAKDTKENYVGTEETINGETYKILTTNEKGIITAGLKEGLYKAVEVEAPKSFEFNENEETRTSYFGIGKSTPAVKETKAVWENTEREYFEYHAVTTVSDGVIAVGNDGQVIKYDLKGNIVWENTEKSYHYRSVTSVAGGVIAVGDSGKVVKYDLEGNVVWENTEKSYGYYGVTTVEDGVIAVARGGQVVKYDLEGKIVWENTEKSYSYRGVTTVADGVIAVSYNGQVVKYDLDGNVVWENTEKSYNYEGVTTVEDGVIAVGWYGKVVKYDLEGKVVWENTKKSYWYYGVTTVTDGVIAVSGNGQVVKYDLEGNVVWKNIEKSYKYYGVTTVEDGVITVGYDYGQVVKYDLEGNIEWETTEKSYKYYGVTTVEDGVIAVSSWGQVVKYDLEENVAWENTEKSYNYYGVTTVEDGLIAVGYYGQIVKYDLKGNIVWENTEKSYSYIEVTTVGGGIIAVGHYGQVVKYDLEGNVVWENTEKSYNYYGVTKVEDGIIVVATGGQVVKYDLEGNVVWENTENTEKSYDYREVTTVEDGVIAIGVYGQVVKYDLEGHVVWENMEKSYYYNGVTTVADGVIAVSYNGQVVKYDLEGKVVWENTEKSYTYYGITTVEDGVIAVSHKGQVVKYAEVETLPEIAQSQEITVQNKTKELKIKTEVEQYEKDGIIITGGTITGQEEEYVEQVEYEKDSTKGIKAIPDTGYRVEKITVNGKQIEFTPNEDGSVTLSKFIQVTEDKDIVVKFSNSIGQVKVNHYIKGTTTVVPDEEIDTSSKTITGEIGTSYTTEPLVELKEYELVKDSNGEYEVPANAVGTYTEGVQEVNYYYELKDVKLTVHHYLENSETKLAEDEEKVGKIHTNYTTEKSNTIDYTKYELVEEPGNKEGTLEQDTEVIYYYKLKEGKVIVHHYIKGTTTQVPSKDGIKVADETIIGKVDETYTTKASENIATNYEYVSKTTNSTGTITAETIEVTYYYKMKAGTVEENNVTKEGTGIIYTPEQEVEYSINYTTKITNYKGRVQVIIIDKLPQAIDETKSDIADGEYDSTNKTITWKQYLPEIDIINGEAQEITITKQIKLVYKSLQEGTTITNKVEGTIKLLDTNQEETKETGKETKINEYINVTVEKVWDDNENANGKRPESIKLLVKNGDITVAEQVVTEAENWKYTFTNLPKYNTQGNEIEYTVDEQEVNADELKFYTKTISGTTITNTFTVPGEKTEVTAIKLWDDNNNENGKRPESIKLQVKNGDTVVKEQVVTEAENWKYTFTDLPMYDEQGNTISYTVDEQEVNADDLKFYTKEINGKVITNTFTVPEDKTEITVAKVWNDNENANGKRPESIKLLVKNGDITVAEQVVTEAENWQYTFTDLPKYNAQGNEIVYTVDETEVNTNDLKFYTKAIEETTVINTFTVPEDKTEVTVTKVWDDNNNANGKRPESIKLLVKNGTQVVAEQVVTEAENWKYTFTNLAKYNEQGNVINYTVDEQEVNTDDLKFYTKTITGTTITNTFSVPDNKISITVNKMWNDGNNMYGKRPGSIKLQVKNGGTVVQEATVTENDGWRYTFTDLAKYDGQGNEIVYTVDEQEINANDLKFYTKEVNGTMITNTFTVPDEKINVTIEKVWKDNNNKNNKRPEAIMLQVKNGQMIVEEQEVTAKENWKYTFIGLAKYDMQGNEITYTADEKEINVDDLKFYTKTITGTTITNTFTVPEEKVSVTVNKVWNDNNNVNSKRPESIKLQVKNGSQVAVEQVVTETENWRYTFTDLPKYNAQGNENVYTVDEQETNANDLKFYTKTIEGMTITNTFTVPEDKTEITVNKVWNDSENANGKRPENIKLLVKNGDTVVKEQVVTEDENWKYTFTDLPKYNAQGNENVYTVDEAEVNANDLKFYTKTIDRTTIINTFTVPNDKITLKVSKIWDDSNNAKGYRPESIKLLVKNGNILVAEQVVTKEENWENTFTDLAKYDEQGNEIIYIVEEAEVNSNELERYKGELSKVVGNKDKEVIIVNTYNYGKVIIKHVEKDTNKELEVEEQEGVIGEKYTTKQKDIEGYKYVSRTENATGEIGKEETVVIYYYEKIKEETKPVTPILPTTGDTFITEMIILVVSATAYLAVLALKQKRCK